ncbi:GMC family oxidoreductase N-terminal domain-containing protein [Pimelobacter simplex]|uniref:GMC family oxidoreductase N-terminal domain-containing protein n=1 Tax=Nocardioides simplex TaxID=2045 RepID=UPI0021502577|nr:GMC family oxidoreductase [Pimelobacter simplex]UUW88030.1 GMC family oxidoreductase [Pimelobacter simplex]UUW97534.1 GMC family oxidoreductase [Pimelobacter simplex]
MTHYDVLVIGSGFGGSVTALRLAEKGYRVGVLEAGRRFADDELPTSSWKVRDYVFNPALGCYGLLRMTLLKDVLVLTGAGVGGGSLVYANTLYEPPAAFYDDPHWAAITDWADELAPYYDQARRMLGVTAYPHTSPSDRVMRSVADGLGVGKTFRPTDVGVLFGERPGQRVPDPFFGGAGPERTTCTDCGACMTGCRVGAKNTTVKNYLHLAEAAGAVVHPLTTVTDVRPRPGGGYAVTTRRTEGKLRRGRSTFTADQVVFAAASLGTQRLLHRLCERGSLPRISPRLGELTRTNSEAILGVRARGDDVDYSRGVAITSSLHVDEHTHVEPVRYGRGSNLLGLLMAALTDAPGDGRSRALAGLREMWRQRRDLPRLHDPRGWSEQTIVLLVMQSLDNSLTTYLRRRPWGRTMSTRQGTGAANPVWIPQGHDVARSVAAEIDGIPGGTWADLVNVPATGHLIGGCPIGESAADGVVDPYHRLHGYDGLHVIDGSTVAANLGVNPSLTITAMAERAVAMWPNRGEADGRPAPGSSYVRVAPVAPRAPAVPAGAPAGYRVLDWWRA